MGHIVLYHPDILAEMGGSDLDDFGIFRLKIEVFRL